MDIGTWLTAAVWCADLVFVSAILFFERKRSETALCWILVLLFFPLIGFIFYLFFGLRVLHRKEEDRLCGAEPHDETNVLAVLNAHTGGEGVTYGNTVELFSEGEEKYAALMRDIKAAKHSIYLLYFIIRGDRLGLAILDALARKAAEGVAVRLLYDHGGSFFTSKQLFRSLRRQGGEVRRFFPISLGYYLRVNYRNHRKIVVIDEKIGYLGGINIGEEYVGDAIRHQVPWRDMHLRLTGPAVGALLRRFRADWQFAGGTLWQIETRQQDAVQGGAAVQIVSSGPFGRAEGIKWNYIRMLCGARRSVMLMTPYFVPDSAFLETLRITAASGVRVRLLLPSRADNYLVHRVSLSYARQLTEDGVEVALYSGFLHAKMVVMDERIVSIGTANLDRRSFSLNFETNAVIYDDAFAKECRTLFEADWETARCITREEAEREPLFRQWEAGVYRLLAPLL